MSYSSLLVSPLKAGPMGLYLVFWYVSISRSAIMYPSKLLLARITIFLAFQAQVACYVTPRNHLRARSTDAASTASGSASSATGTIHNGPG